MPGARCHWWACISGHGVHSPCVQHLADKDQVLDASPTKKVLGMLWDITSDMLRFSCKQATSTPPLSTKREVLQETAKVFDPLGLLQPVTVAAKILIQELWKEGIDWDEPLPPSLDQKWRAVAKEIGDATKLEFPRCYFTSDVSVDSSDTELHVFADASQKAYGKVVCCSNKEETYPSRAGTYGSFNSCMFSFISSRTTVNYKSHSLV